LTSEAEIEDVERRKLNSKLQEQRAEAYKRQRVQTSVSPCETMDSNSRMMKLGFASSAEPTEDNQAASRRKPTEPSLDNEIESLMKVYENTQKEIRKDLKALGKNVSSYTEPEAVNILDTKIDHERIYLANIIIENEMKQIAESITRVTHAKKISNDSLRKSAFAQKYGPPLARKTRNMNKDSS
jgi:hypothetical protein